MSDNSPRPRVAATSAYECTDLHVLQVAHPVSAPSCSRRRVSVVTHPVNPLASRAGETAPSLLQHTQSRPGQHEYTRRVPALIMPALHEEKRMLGQRRGQQTPRSRNPACHSLTKSLCCESGSAARSQHHA